MTNEKPETQSEEIKDEGEILEKVFEFTPSGTCTYVQRGPYLVCTSCELQHARWIGMDRIMVGEDEKGQPIVQKRFKA